MSHTSPALVAERLTDGAAGVVSICTAHPIVIEAALARGLTTGRRVLIEATCNQVNQEGGYTGMTPAGFRRFVDEIAGRLGFDPGRIILGGDHLGPNPWKHLPARDAMQRASAMIEDYARAGFVKLHLDTSMGCAGEDAALPDAVTAERAAMLAKAAEAAVGDGPRPIYIIGTEVPVPGGAQHGLDHIDLTRPEAALATVAVHRQAFAAAGCQDAFARAVAVVVQPGVEFGNADVIAYRREAARALSATLGEMPQFVFEAHSTDYQPATALRDLVADGFAILKVGPWLTFALREALYGLDAIAQTIDPEGSDETLRATMEALMVREPGHWQKYYDGDDAARRVQRHYSYSDRIRYYWPHPIARDAVARLMARLGDRTLPHPLVSQCLGGLFPAVERGEVPARARDLLIAAVQHVLARYEYACHP